MTLAEFKAWFEGFTESMDGAPNDAQWDRVKAKIASLKAEPTFSYRDIEPIKKWDEGSRYGGPLTCRGVNDAFGVGKVEFNQTKMA